MRSLLIGSALLLALAAACTGDDGDDASSSGTATGTTSTGGEGGTGNTGGEGGTSSGTTSTGGEGGTGGQASSTHSPGYSTGQGLAEGEHTFMLDDLARKYVLRLPQNYDPNVAWPLVLALHGNGGSVAYWDVTDGPRNIRGVLETEAILIIAEAIDGKWRDYDADSSTWPDRIEQELVYFEEVLTQAKTDLCIDESAIFSMGFSGGGSFSGVLGCRRDDIRGIAVGGSVIYFDEDNCPYTPAAWITIGTQELNAGREAFRDFFRDKAGCDATLNATDPSPCEAYEACGANTPVHYCQHPDGHIWPGFGSEAMWAFFSSLLED